MTLITAQIIRTPATNQPVSHLKLKPPAVRLSRVKPSA
jgi:hypothetical protein